MERAAITLGRGANGLGARRDGGIRSRPARRELVKGPRVPPRRWRAARLRRRRPLSSPDRLSRHVIVVLVEVRQLARGEGTHVRSAREERRLRARRRAAVAATGRRVVGRRRLCLPPRREARRQGVVRVAQRVVLQLDRQRRRRERAVHGRPQVALPQVLRLLLPQVRLARHPLEAHRARVAPRRRQDLQRRDRAAPVHPPALHAGLHARRLDPHR